MRNSEFMANLDRTDRHSDPNVIGTDRQVTSFLRWVQQKNKLRQKHSTYSYSNLSIMDNSSLTDVEPWYNKYIKFLVDEINIANKLLLKELSRNPHESVRLTKPKSYIKK